MKKKFLWAFVPMLVFLLVGCGNSPKEEKEAFGYTYDEWMIFAEDGQYYEPYALNSVTEYKTEGRTYYLIESQSVEDEINSIRYTGQDIDDIELSLKNPSADYFSADMPRMDEILGKYEANRENKTFTKIEE
ncbi:hypothetical protein [Enterococcus sp. DIV0660C]|uniref:hypothetical protein n=1 Tax=Enterococcus sp. DIV0660C TaxID=2230880 RepID=UPI001A8F2937|nr:hypothetical protein [Enterococcus sp. DIV0660C]MBO0431280.1 hypothetical protein [Enterococcus sp. DIV0660C]